MLHFASFGWVDLGQVLKENARWLLLVEVLQLAGLMGELVMVTFGFQSLLRLF